MWPKGGRPADLHVSSVEGYPTSCTPPLHARLFHIQNPPKSQICHLSTNASNRATSLKVSRHIKVMVEKLHHTFYTKVMIPYAAAASENISPFHHTKLDF